MQDRPWPLKLLGLIKFWIFSLSRIPISTFDIPFSSYIKLAFLQLEKVYIC